MRQELIHSILPEAGNIQMQGSLPHMFQTNSYACVSKTTGGLLILLFASFGLIPPAFLKFLSFLVTEIPNIKHR